MQGEETTLLGHGLKASEEGGHGLRVHKVKD
jgi:hypothetical protein